MHLPHVYLLPLRVIRRRTRSSSSGVSTSTESCGRHDHLDPVAVLQGPELFERLQPLQDPLGKGGEGAQEMRR